MTLNKLRLRANEKGFTLIELMIVIAIIGILAAIAIPNYIAYRDKAYCSAAESDANAVTSAMSDYFSIPSNQSIGTRTDVTALTLGGSTIRMSGAGGTQNKLTITPPGAGESAYLIKVTDGSTRCPSTYRKDAAKWSKEATGGSYSVTM